MDFKKVRDNLGHENIATTSVYVHTADYASSLERPGNRAASGSSRVARGRPHWRRGQTKSGAPTSSMNEILVERCHRCRGSSSSPTGRESALGDSIGPWVLVTRCSAWFVASRRIATPREALWTSIAR